MSEKAFKALRRQAEVLMDRYVQEFVFTVDQLGEALTRGKRLYTYLPKSMLMPDGTTKKQGVLSQRWFYRFLKKNPDATYEEILNEAGIKAQRPASAG